MLLSASWWSRRRLQEQTTGHAPQGQRRDPCGFFCKGRAAMHFTRGSAQGACARVLHSSNRLLRQNNSSRPYRFFAVAHNPSAIAMTTSKRPVESFFFTDYVHITTYIIIIILPSFSSRFIHKNGSFQHIEIHTGAPLAPFPQISPKNHYKHDNRTDINQSSTYLTNEKRNCNIRLYGVP